MKVRHFYGKVPGYSIHITDLYQRFVRECADEAHIVEVGSYKGRSAACLCVEALNSGKRIKVDLVDLWAEAADIVRNAPIAYEPATLAECKANLSPVMDLMGDALRFIACDSAKAAELYPDASLDLVMIDADHSYYGCARDIAAWWPKVKPGGKLAGHDFTPEYPGVIQAVEEAFPTGLNQIGCVWIKSKET